MNELRGFTRRQWVTFLLVISLFVVVAGLIAVGSMA